MKQLSYLWFLIHICLSVAEEKAKREATDKPNIILILADDMGYGDLNSFGHHVQEGGFLDHMVYTGMKFPQFYSGDNLCTPSRAALMTGRLPVRVGMVGGYRVILAYEKGGLPKKELTIPELLKENGYATGMVGKWHLGINAQNSSDGSHLPKHHGFDYVGFNLPFTNHWSCDELGLFTSSTMELPNPAICYLYKGDQIYSQPFHLNYIDHQLLDSFNEFVDTTEEPFFFYFGAPHVHTALWAMEEFFGKSKRGIFGDNVNELHWVVEEMVKKLEDKGIDKNTLIIFTSDHGPHKELCTYGGVTSGLLGGKSNSYEGGHRVPTIAYWPGTIPPGSINNDVFSHMDLIQTFVDLAGGAMPTDRHYDGVSFKSVLLDPTTKFDAVDNERPIFFWCGKRFMALRLGSYKAHYVTIKMFSTADRAIYCPGGKPLKDFYLSFLCDDSEVTYHDPPLIFDVDEDPYELYTLNATTLSNYDEVLTSLNNAKTKHLNTIEKVPDILGDFDMALTPCCSGDTTSCSCNYPGTYP